MQLKTVTTGLLIFAFLMLLGGMPLVMSRNPGPDAAERARAQYALLLGSYIVILFIVVFVVIVLAWIVLRRTAAEYRAEAAQNMQTFVEGTLRDHAKKQEVTGQANPENDATE